MWNLFQCTRCVLCHEEIATEMGWVQLFSKESDTPLCSSCQKRLSLISGETCRICGRSFDNGEYLYKRGDSCFDCIRWEEDPEWSGLLESNISLYFYNDFLKESLATFKFRGDYIIVHAFSDLIKIKLAELAPEIIVPIPLSAERLYERGFNQAEAMITEAGFIPTQLLSRIHSEKQSKKSRSERIQLPQVFRLAPEAVAEKIKGKSVLLVDDIYTTGSTLRHAAKILKDAGAKIVTSLTLARG